MHPRLVLHIRTDDETDDANARASTAKIGDRGRADGGEEVQEEELAEVGGGVGDGIEPGQEEGEDAAAGDDEEAREIGQGQGEEVRADGVGPHLVLAEQVRPLRGDVRGTVPCVLGWMGVVGGFELGVGVVGLSWRCGNTYRA